MRVTLKPFEGLPGGARSAMDWLGGAAPTRTGAGARGAMKKDAISAMTAPVMMMADHNSRRGICFIDTFQKNHVKWSLNGQKPVVIHLG
jgi:hypothetical protein